MYELFTSARQSIYTIKTLVEHNEIDEKYELIIFRHDSGIVEDLLSDLDEAIAVAIDNGEK